MARRRQGSPCTNGNNTSDSEESKGSPKNNANSCKHCGQRSNVLKGINSQKVHKGSFIGEILASRQCKQCKVDECKIDPEAGLYICLQCGQCACDDKEKKHATQHYSAQRSDPHFIGLHLNEWKFHCFKCNEELDPAVHPKLPDLLRFIKAQSAKRDKIVVNSNSVKETNNVSEEDTSSSLQKKKVSNSAFCNTSKVRQFNGLKMCRVRGLSNLGNTCFFNSVLQCLAQTPFLLDLLNEIREPDEEFILPEKDGEEAVKLVLGKWGPVTEALANTLAEISTPEYSAFAPRKLLDALRQKCPQFQGYDQHDSHELLRHLLECVRLEDLKRYQKQIFAHNGTSTKINPQEIDKETAEVLKKMNQRIQDTVFLRPEHLFKGMLVSTLTCKSCNHVSDTEERFLDLSLPIAGEKPQPKKKAAEYPNRNRFTDNKRRMRRNQRTTSQQSNYFSQPSPENGQGDSCSPKKLDESDGAEVEDNDDSKKADGESGYSSEKPGSARVSPIPTPNTPENMCSVADSINSEYSPENSNVFENGSLSLSVRISPIESTTGRGSPIPPESTAGCGSPDSTCANASPGSPSGFEDPHTTGVDANSVKTKLSNLDFSSGYHNNCLLSNVNSGSSSEFYKNHKQLDSISEFRENYDQPLMDNLDPYSAPENNENENDNENDRTLTTSDTNAQSLDGVYSEINILRNGSNDDYNVPTSTNSNVESPVSNPAESEEEDDDNIVGPSNFMSFSRYSFNDTELSVTSCLNQFTALELMTGSNKVSCENCVKVQNKGKSEKAIYSTASKRFLIRSPPAVLILHLKRFQVLYTSFQKIHRFVSFPLILDIDPYCSDKCRETVMYEVLRWQFDEKVFSRKCSSVLELTLGPSSCRISVPPEWRSPGKKEILYSLYGVVVHSGSLGGGHYIAYVKARSPPTPDGERLKFVQGLKNPFKKEKTLNEENNKEGDIGKEQNGLKEDQDQSELNQGTQWYYISDSHVSAVSESEVLKCEAYLLFYERIL